MEKLLELLNTAKMIIKDKGITEGTAYLQTTIEMVDAHIKEFKYDLSKDLSITLYGDLRKCIPVKQELFIKMFGTKKELKKDFIKKNNNNLIFICTDEIVTIDMIQEILNAEGYNVNKDTCKELFNKALSYL